MAHFGRAVSGMYSYSYIPIHKDVYMHKRVYIHIYIYVNRNNYLQIDYLYIYICLRSPGTGRQAVCSARDVASSKIANLG